MPRYEPFKQNFLKSCEFVSQHIHVEPSMIESELSNSILIFFNIMPVKIFLSYTFDLQNFMLCGESITMTICMFSHRFDKYIWEALVRDSP